MEVLIAANETRLKCENKLIIWIGPGRYHGNGWMRRIVATIKAISLTLTNYRLNGVNDKAKLYLIQKYWSEYEILN